MTKMLHVIYFFVVPPPNLQRESQKSDALHKLHLTHESRNWAEVANTNVVIEVAFGAPGLWDHFSS